MRILCTGGAGYIGSAVATRMLEEGHEVVVIDDLRTGKETAVPKGAQFIFGDFSDLDLLRFAFRGNSADVVVHTAASMSPTESISDPKVYFNNNLRKGVALLDALLHHHIPRIMFSSSACVYGIPDTSIVAEEDTQTGITAYGDSKLMFERIADWYSRAYGLTCVSLRYFNVSGAVGKVGPDKPYNNGVIPILLRSILDGGEFNIFGTDYPTLDGTCIRDYVHIADVVTAHLAALEAKGGAYNIGSGLGHSIKTLVGLAEQVLGVKASVIHEKRRPGDPDTLVANIDKSVNELGWIPAKSDIAGIVRDTAQWMLERRKQ